MKKEKFSMRLCAFATAALLLISGMAKLTPIPASAASSSEIRKQINALKEEKEEIKEKSPMFRCSIRKTRTKSRTLFPEKTSSTRNCSCSMTWWKTFSHQFRKHVSGQEFNFHQSTFQKKSQMWLLGFAVIQMPI